MGLTENARQWVLRELPYDRGDPALVIFSRVRRPQASCHLPQLGQPAGEDQPRTVRKSSAFQKNPLTTQRANDLAQIVADIEQGRDLKKYLSRDIVRASVRAPGAGRRPDLDLLGRIAGTALGRCCAAVPPLRWGRRPCVLPTRPLPHTGRSQTPLLNGGAHEKQVCRQPHAFRRRGRAGAGCG
jgi:hypothetical protein